MLSVGGRKSKVKLDINNGDKTRIIYCNVDQKIAETLGKKLYTFVGLRGHAKWDAETLDLKHFRIEEITSYEEGTLLDGVNELRKIAGKFFENIHDVDQFVSDIRAN